jgi:hypothetical protein
MLGEAVALANGDSGEGKEVRVSGGRRVVNDPAGGGATAVVEWRPEAQHYRRQASRAGEARARGRRREGRRSWGLV